MRHATSCGFCPIGRLRVYALNPKNTKSRKTRAVPAVQSCLAKRRGGDSNSRYPFGQTGFRNRRIQPLCHLSGYLVAPVIAEIYRGFSGAGRDGTASDFTSPEYTRCDRSGGRQCMNPISQPGRACSIAASSVGWMGSFHRASIFNPFHPLIDCPIMIRCPSGVLMPNSRIPHGLSSILLRKAAFFCVSCA